MEIRENFDLTGPISYAVDRRSNIKLRGTPTIVICMPVGPKDTKYIFETPDGNQWNGAPFITPAMVPVQWALNHMRIVTPLNTSMTYLVKWGERSAKARQHMTMQALEMNPDYILYWDDDVLVEPLSLYTLYNFMQQTPEAGAVTGVYCTRESPTEPMIYKRHGEGAYWGFQAGPEAKPEEIFSCGAGFLLVRASVIRQVIADNPGEPVWADEFMVQLDPSTEVDPNRRTMWGHDIRFCKLIQESGSKVFVDGRVMLGHIDIETGRVFALPEDSLPYRNNPNLIFQDVTPSVPQETDDGASAGGSPILGDPQEVAERALVRLPQE